MEFIAGLGIGFIVTALVRSRYESTARIAERLRIYRVPSDQPPIDDPPDPRRVRLASSLMRRLG